MAMGQTNDSSSDQPDRTRTCTGCTDTYRITKVAILPCSDTYCAACLKRLFDTALKNENKFPPRCCDAIPLKSVRTFLDEETLRKYIKRKAEHDAKDRMYCSGCSAFICAEYVEGDVAVCPECGAMTCIACRNKAHENDCPEDKGQQALIETAKRKGWRQCWACQSMVERVSGCSAIQCRCGAVFCYVCGEPFTKNKPLCACNGLQAPYVIGGLPVQHFVPEPEWFPEDDFPPVMPQQMYTPMMHSADAYRNPNLDRDALAKVEGDQRRLGLVGGTVPFQYQQGYNGQGLPWGTDTLFARISEDRVARGARKLDPSAPHFFPHGPHYQDSAAQFPGAQWPQFPQLANAESVDEEIYADWLRVHDARINGGRKRLRSLAPVPVTNSLPYRTGFSADEQIDGRDPGKGDRDWRAQDFHRARRDGDQGFRPFRRI
ncbi:uncharacterized protein BDV14DRAFT_200240 [Aspergillus stella-maris]|uniref:uncharacterized protein n=1 Tax=Aspergillus stella-maris TaxID=1810926 RepID=UPI003CCD92DB